MNFLQKYKGTLQKLDLVSINCGMLAFSSCFLVKGGVSLCTRNGILGYLVLYGTVCPLRYLKVYLQRMEIEKYSLLQ